MDKIKENLQNLLDKEGLMRGEVILNHIDFIEQKEGKEGVNTIKNSFKKLDCPLDLSVDPMDWEKVSMGSAIIALASDLFEWENEDVKEMGRYAAKTLTVNKLMFREIPDLDGLLEKVNEYWKTVIDVGSLSVENSEEGRVELVLKGFDYHPLDLIFISGYIEVIFDLFTEEDVTTKYNLENEKCKFLITWS